MNLVEHYIVEVHDVVEITEDWGSFVMVDVTVNCYGHVSRQKTSFTDFVEWKKVREKGYYLA